MPWPDDHERLVRMIADHSSHFARFLRAMALVNLFLMLVLGLFILTIGVAKGGVPSELVWAWLLGLLVAMLFQAIAKCQAPFVPRK